MPKNGLLSIRKGVINVNVLSSEKKAQDYKEKWSNFGTFWLLQNDFFTAKNLELSTGLPPYNSLNVSFTFPTEAKKCLF